MKKTNTLFLLLMALLVAFCCCPSTFAQQDSSGPSLQETMEWIKGKLLDTTFRCSFEKKITSVSVSGSTLTYTEAAREESGQYSEQHSGERHTINFADIDPDSVKVKESTNCESKYYVNLETSSAKKTIRWEYLPIYKLDLSSSWGLPAPDEDLAQRLAKAVKHAVILSGGKRDIF